MAITFPITGVTNNATSRSPAFTLGTAPATDDVIVLFVNSTTVHTATDVSGWTNVLGANTVVSSDAHTGHMHYHKVTSGESGASTVTWTLTNLLDTSVAWRVTATVLRGVDPADAVAGAAASGFDSANGATPFVIPSVTPDDTGSQIVAGLVADSGTVTQTTPGGWTLQASGGSNYLYSRDTLGTSGVPTGTTNVTPSTGDEYVGIAQAFKALAATNASAGSAAVTTTANNPTIAGASIIGLATTTATAHNPAGSVGAKPGAAAVTATAHNPGTSGSSAVGRATVTATANNPAPSVAVNTGAASITATAHNPTVSTAAATNAPAGAAAITATAHNPTVSISVSVGVATVTATAYNPTVSIGAKPGAASVTATAYNPAGSVDARPGLATITGTAFGPTEFVSVGAGLATITGTAFGPTALTEGTVLGPYRTPLRWHEPSVESGHEPPIAAWHEPSPTVGSHQ